MGKSGKTKKDETAKWIVRGAVVVILVTLVVLAFLDRSAKANATTTTTTWLNALQTATDEQKDLFYSDLTQHVSGTPQITGEASRGQVVYSWNGIFRTYATTVTFEGNDPSVVVRIEGPGS